MVLIYLKRTTDMGRIEIIRTISDWIIRIVNSYPSEKINKLKIKEKKLRSYSNLKCFTYSYA